MDFYLAALLCFIIGNQYRKGFESEAYSWIWLASGFVHLLVAAFR